MQDMWIKANFKLTHCLKANKTANTLCLNCFFASLIQIFVLSVHQKTSNGKPNDCSSKPPENDHLLCCFPQLKWAYSCFELSVIKHCTVPAQHQRSRNTQKVTGVALMHRGRTCRGGAAAALCSFLLYQPFTQILARSLTLTTPEPFIICYPGQCR